MDSAELARRRRQTQIIVDLARIRSAADRWVEDALVRHELRDITPAQANLLMVLFNARRPLTGAELARALGISEVTVSRFLKKMDAAGWVQRARDTEDARRVLVRPTGKAREALPRFILLTNTLLDTTFGPLPASEVDRLAELLTEIREALSAATVR